MSMDEIEFCSRGYPFGTVDNLFKSEEEISAVANDTMENGKWFLFPIYIRKRAGNIKVNAEMILAAVFQEIC